jgi:hypothetical protein
MPNSGLWNTVCGVRSEQLAGSIFIADAARTLVERRDRWLNPPDTSPEELKKRTLTNLYNQRPTWLANAHRTLDEAVFAAYGWPANLTTQQILANLLTLNHERAAGWAAQAEGSREIPRRQTARPKQIPSG